MSGTPSDDIQKSRVQDEYDAAQTPSGKAEALVKGQPSWETPHSGLGEDLETQNELKKRQGTT